MSAKAKTDKHKRLMLDALNKTLGIVTKACNVSGVSRSQHYKWVAEDPEYKAEVEDVGEIAVDFAESSLHKQINEGSTAATIFYLKTKGKKRGYIERQEIEFTEQPLFPDEPDHEMD